METSHRLFVEGTRAMLTSGLAYKNTSSLQHSIRLTLFGTGTSQLVFILLYIKCWIYSLKIRRRNVKLTFKRYDCTVKLLEVGTCEPTDRFSLSVNISDKIFCPVCSTCLKKSGDNSHSFPSYQKNTLCSTLCSSGSPVPASTDSSFKLKHYKWL